MFELITNSKCGKLIRNMIGCVTRGTHFCCFYGCGFNPTMKHFLGFSGTETAKSLPPFCSWKVITNVERGSSLESKEKLFRFQWTTWCSVLNVSFFVRQMRAANTIISIVKAEGAVCLRVNPIKWSMVKHSTVIILHAFSYLTVKLFTTIIIVHSRAYTSSFPYHWIWIAFAECKNRDQNTWKNILQ